MKRRNRRFAILSPARWSPTIWLTVLLRVAAMLVIAVQPFAGMMASFFMDWFDSYLLIQRAGISREEYHALDKNLDQAWSVVMLLVSLATPYRYLLSVLFIFRLVGHGVFLVTNDTRVFLVFPNVFEFAFLWFVALAPWGSTAVGFWPSLAVLTVLKLCQEIALHWIWPARLRAMKRHWHGYSPLLRALGWRRLGI